MQLVGADHSRLRALLCTFALGGCLAIAGAPWRSCVAEVVDYSKADLIRTYNPLRIGGRVYPNWLKDGTRFYYTEERDGADRGLVYLVDPRGGKKSLLFENARIASSLAKIAGVAVDPSRLPKWLLADDEAELHFILNGRSYWCPLKTQVCAKTSATIAMSAGAARPSWVVRSPDNHWDAFVFDNNVYVRPAVLTDAETRQKELSGQSDTGVETPRPGVRVGEWCDEPVPRGIPAPLPAQSLPPGSTRLTEDGVALWGYANTWRGGLDVSQIDYGRYQLSSGTLIWSPDSKKIVARREDLRRLRTYPLYSSTSNQPVDHSYYYAAPGDERIPQLDWYVLDVGHQAVVPVLVPPTGLTDVPSDARWGADSKQLFIVSSNRGPKMVTLSAVDPFTGAARPIIEETSPTFVELQSGNDGENLQIVANGSDIIWFSERDGWGHLYRYSKDGSLKNRVESGDYSVADLMHVDAANKTIYFTAWGKAPGIPYYAHLYRVNFDGSGMQLLSPEPGNHTIQFSPSGSYFLDTFSSIDTPPVTVLRGIDGHVVLELSKGNVDGLRRTGWTPAETFTVKARDGVTDLYGVMYKPSNFDPARHYAIITNIYPGPQIGSVGDWVFKGPDSYAGTRVETEQVDRNENRVTSKEGMGRSLAELGFIVIELDAMGSAHRSKAFEDYFYGHVADGGLPDQISAIKQLAVRYPWIDPDRVGVFGHSGGGFAAGAAMLHYPGFFKVGVSESGNHDFRIYGWYWGEKYQGLYEKRGTTDNYEAEADYKYAANLQGKLLLIHGDMDCNNPPAETLRVVDALVKANKDFDMLLVPDAGHQMPDYVTRRVWDYFVRNLLLAEPPKNYHLMGLEEAK